MQSAYRVVAVFVAVIISADLAGAEAIGHSFLCADYSGNKVSIVSADGTVTWEYAVKGPQDVWVLPNGNILLSHLRGAREVTPGKEVAWEYTTAAPNEIHTCQPLGDGVVLIGECGASRLIEVDRSGRIRKEVKIKTTGGVHGQMRICRKTREGTYVVALTSQHLVGEFDGEGKVIRTIKTPGDPYIGLRLPNGNTLIGCGDGHKLIEVDPKDKVVWRIDENELPGHPLRFVAGVQRLGNGNTVVCNWGGHGHVGEQPQIFEVTRDKKVVWQVFDFKRLGTISSVQLTDVKGDVTKGEILR